MLTSRRSSSLAFIGLGVLGRPMATNLFLRNPITNLAEKGDLVVCEPNDGHFALFMHGLSEAVGGGEEFVKRVKRVGDGAE
jgi:hypothetical protein